MTLVPKAWEMGEMNGMVYDSPEYHLISQEYGTRLSMRSQVPLMSHIHEGLLILSRIQASQATMKAFCLHPLLQNDQDLAKNASLVARCCDPWCVLLAMEYRSVANAYLSAKVGNIVELCLSALPEVNQMLVADKVQNRKDFEIYHKSSHPRSAELQQYFQEWLSALHVEEQAYQQHVAAIKNSCSNCGTVVY